MNDTKIQNKKSNTWHAFLFPNKQIPPSKIIDKDVPKFIYPMKEKKKRRTTVSTKSMVSRRKYTGVS